MSVIDRSQWNGDDPLNVNIETPLKSELITEEFEAFVNMLHKTLSQLMEFRNELNCEFCSNKEISGYLDNVFRDIESLYMVYSLVKEKIVSYKNQSNFCFPDIFLDKETRASLIFHKSFLNQYGINAKWISQFHKDDELCQKVCRRTSERISTGEIVQLENCLYSIFNALFSYDLFLSRYAKCFNWGHPSRKKAEDVRGVIANILKQSSQNQNQEIFFRTHKELNLLIGKKKIPEVNTQFLLKYTAKKYSPKTNKEVSRQLVLFSDGLYVTSPPANVSGPNFVHQELSLKSMEVTIIPEDKIPNQNLKWGLNIENLETKKNFFFDDEKTMLAWQDKLEESIKSNKKEIDLLPCNGRNSWINFGEIPPQWQKDSVAEYCNGLKCSARFSPTVRRHHCRADGLLYCDDCTSFRLKLPFDKENESRICELCFRILSNNGQNSESVMQAKRELDLVFERKNRTGLKLNWLETKVYNSDKCSFSAPIHYFCELDARHPFLKMYTKAENKIRQREIILLGMNIALGNESKYYKKMKPYQFCIEHRDRPEAYLFNTSSKENCEKWVECIRQSINAYCSPN